MNPNILHLMTATQHTVRYRRQYSRPLKMLHLLKKIMENVGDINTERPLEKQI